MRNPAGSSAGRPLALERRADEAERETDKTGRSAKIYVTGSSVGILTE